MSAPEGPLGALLGTLAAVGDLSQEPLALLPAYGYLVIGAAVFTAACGAPIPVAVLLLAAGTLASEGILAFPLTVLAALGAAVVGDCALYGVARLGGRPLLCRAGPRFGISSELLEQAEGTFRRRGGWAVWLTRWLLTPAGAAVTVLAGANRYPLGAFLFCDLTGQAISAGAYVGLGWLFGDNWPELADLIANLSGFLLPATVALLLGVVAWRLLRRRPGRGSPTPGGAPAPAAPPGRRCATGPADATAR